MMMINFYFNFYQFHFLSIRLMRIFHNTLFALSDDSKNNNI
jgi:hypothetical protein